ncbi:MAG: hypothetical protein WC712_06590 [Candidatus Brocadiia bacterium]
MNRQISTTILVVALAAALSGFVLAEAPTDPIAQRKADALKFIADVERLYPYFDLKGIKKDWEGRKGDWRRRAESLQNDQELVVLFGDCIEALRDGSAKLDGLSVTPTARIPEYWSGLSFGEPDDKRVLLVTDATWCYPEAKMGAEVLTIDGKNPRVILKETADMLWRRGGNFSSPQRATWLAWKFGLRGGRDDVHKVVLQIGKVKSEITTANALFIKLDPKLETKMPDMKTTNSNKFCSYKLLDGGIGYVCLSWMMPTGESAINEAMKAMGMPPNYIIDISDAGGSDYCTLAGLTPYRDHIVALIGPGTTGFGELYARDLVTNCGAKLFGAQTAGAASVTETMDLPRRLGKLIYSVSSQQGLGKPIEFNGITPDVRTYYDQKELVAGISVPLEAAKKHFAPKKK